MRKSTRLIALLMTLLMLVGMMPFSMFAVPSSEDHDHDHEDSYAGESVTGADAADVKAKVEAIGGTLVYYDNFESKLEAGVNLLKIPYGEGAALPGVIGSNAYKSWSGAMHFERENGNVAVKFLKCNDNIEDPKKGQDTFFNLPLNITGKDFVFSFDYKHGGSNVLTDIKIGARYGAYRSFSPISIEATGEIKANNAGKKVIGYVNSEVYTTIAMRGDIANNKIYYYVNGALAAEGELFTATYLKTCTDGNKGTAVTKDNIKLESIRAFQRNGVDFPKTGVYVDNLVFYTKNKGGDLGYIYADDTPSTGFVEANDKVYYLLNNSRIAPGGGKYAFDGVDYYFNTKGEVLAADRISLVDMSKFMGSSKNVDNVYAENNGLYAIKSRGRSNTDFKASNGLNAVTLADFLEAKYVEWNVYTAGVQENTMLPLYFNFAQDYTYEGSSGKKPLNIAKDINFGSKDLTVYTANAAKNKTYKEALGVNGWYSITRSAAGFDPTRLKWTETNLEAAGKTTADVLLDSIQFKTGENWGGDTSYTKAIYAADGKTEIFNVDYSVYFTSFNLVKHLEPATSIEDMEMTGWVNMANGDKYYFPVWDHKLVKDKTVEIGGVAYVFDEDGKLVGKANGIHEIQFKDVHYYKDGVMQVGDAYGKYVDGDKVYAINASGDYLGSYAAYDFAKAYADIDRKYERDNYLAAADFNDISLGKKENQGTHGDFAETSLNDAGLYACRRGTYTEIVADSDGDHALRWNGFSTGVHTYFEVRSNKSPTNVALSFDIKLDENWNSNSTLVQELVREGESNDTNILSLNDQGYVTFVASGKGIAKLNSTEYTNITLVIRNEGLNEETSKYVAYADVYVNGVKLIDNEIYYNHAKKHTYIGTFRNFHLSEMKQASSMYLDDIYLYELEEGETPDNVDADWIYEGPIGLGQNADGVNHYYGENGVLLRGEKNIDGDIYLFDNTTGAGVQGVNDKKYYDNGKRDDESVGLVTKAEGQFYFKADHTVTVNESLVEGLVTYVADAEGLVTTKYANKGDALFDAGDLRKYNSAGTLQYNVEGELLYSMLPKQSLLIKGDELIDLTDADALRIKMYIPEAFEDSKVMFILRRDNLYYKLSGNPDEGNVTISEDAITETEAREGAKGYTGITWKTINGSRARVATVTREDGTVDYYKGTYTYYQPNAYYQMKDLGSGWVTFDLVMDNYYHSGDRDTMTLADVFEIQWVSSWGSGDCYISAADESKTMKIESVSVVNFGEKDETLNGIVGDYLYNNGIPQTGWQNVGGDFYYLDPVTGEKATGIKYIPTKMPTGVSTLAATDGLYYDFGESGICNGAVNGIREVEIPVVTDNGVETKTVSRLFQAGVVASNGFVTNELDDKTYYADPETGALIKDGTVKIEDTIYTFDENGAATELNGWYTDETTGDAFYSDPVNGLATGLTVIEIEGVSYYFYFDETTSALKKNYWSDEYGMYFGNDGKAANGMVENVVIGGSNNDKMYFIDGVPSAGQVDKDGMRYIFGDDGKLADTIDLTAAEVVITIKKDNNTQVLNFKLSMGATFAYPVPNYVDYDVTVYDKELNVIPAVGDTVMILTEVTGYTEYTVVYSEKTVSHDWVFKPELSTPATCMKDGFEIWECSNCGKIEKRTVDKSTAEHVFNPFLGTYCEDSNCTHLDGCWAKAREEKCTTDGIRYTYCTVCKDKIKYENIAAAHDWDMEHANVLVPPICDEEGLAEYECRNCTETLVKEFVDKANAYHKNEQFVEMLKPATCVSEGVKKMECTACGGSWTVVVPIDPSNHAWEKDAKLEDATCYTGKENWTWHCTDCGERKEDVVDVAPENWIHDYDAGVLNPAPTCGDPGLMTYTCQNPACGDVHTEIIDPTGLHTWETGNGNYVYDVNDAVFPNHHWYACTVCGAKIDVEEHTITNWVNDLENGTHTGSCVCGYAISAQPHEYEVDGDGNKVFYPGDNNHWNKCSVCDAELDEEAHAYDNKKDASCHWKECECGKIIDKGAHDYTIPKYDDNNHWNECSCGAIDTEIPHSFTQKFDDNNHWNECICTYKKDVTPHIYAEDGNGNLVYNKKGGYHWHDCTACEYDYTKEAHNHVADYDDTNHWKECECGDIIEKVTHTTEQKYDSVNHWDECACGYKTNIVPHKYNEDSNGDRVYTTNDEKHWYDCIECDHVESEGEHDLEQKYDKNDHWKLCPECGYTTTKEPHNITAIMQATEATCTNPGNSEGSWCEDCGLIFVPVEYYGQLPHDVIDIMVSDADGHYYACRNCTTKLDFEQHIFPDDWTCNDKEHKRTCIVCNARDPESGAHKYIENSYTNVDDEAGTAIARCEFCGHETEVKVLTWYEKLGMIKVDGKYYYPVEGVNVTDKLVEFVDGVRYFGEDGALVLTADDLTLDGIEYITFQNARGVIDDAVLTTADGTYCVKKSVIQKDKLIVIGTHYYYFDANGLMVKDEIVDIDGSGTPDYWFDENGIGYELVISDVKSATVTIKDHNGNVLSENVYHDDTEEVVFPAIPTKNGYRFVKWSMTSDEVKAAIENGETAIEITPVFELIDVKYALTVNDEGHTDGKYTVSDLSARTQYTVTAYGVAGKYFAGWESNGSIVSTQAEYTVNIIGDLEITAVYADIPVEPSPVITLTAVATKDANDRAVIVYTVTRDVPNGYTVLSNGLILAKDDKVATIPSVSNVVPGTFIYNFTVAGDEEVCFTAKAYLEVLKDGESEPEIIYTDVIAKSYKELEAE